MQQSLNAANILYSSPNCVVARTPRRSERADRFQCMSRDHLLLVRRDNADLDTACRHRDDCGIAGISLFVDFNAEPAKAYANGDAYGRCVLADAGREHDAVQAAERVRERGSLPPDAVGKKLNGFRRSHVGARKQRAHVTGNTAGYSQQAGAPVEEVFHLLHRQAASLLQIENDAWVQRARPRPHHQPVKRAESHGGVDAPAPAYCAQARAVAEMGDYDALLGQIGSYFPQTVRNVFIGKAVETVTANTLRLIFAWQREAGRDKRHRVVKGGVKAGDLRQVRTRGGNSTDRRDVMWLVQRRQW